MSAELVRASPACRRALPHGSMAGIVWLGTSPIIGVMSRAIRPMIVTARNRL